MDFLHTAFELVISLIHQIRKLLAPRLEFLWNSILNTIQLAATEKNRQRLGQLGTRPGEIWSRLDTKLPGPIRGNGALQLAILLALVVVIVLLNRGANIEDLLDEGELVVISRESPTTWYQGADGLAGPDYDYLKSFADYLGVTLRIENRDTDRDVLEAIGEDEGHIGATGMTYFPPLEEQGLVFGPGFQQVDVQVVCRRGQRVRPKTIGDLEKVELVVVADSGYESRLFALQHDHPDLTWESIEDSSVDELLGLVWRKEIDCTIANSSEVNIKRRFYPELRVEFTLEENQTLAWNLSPEWEVLSDSIEQWLKVIENDGTLLILQDRHYKVQDFDYVDMRAFIRRMKSRLPRLEPLFRKASAEYDIPWTLLAAQAYQESHWNRRAKSPTGVRGIMMLTLTTAREMGVKSRLDPEQSIMGGAKYLSRLLARIPDSVVGDDRWWYALAAYNVGMGHLRDARKLADKLDLDPDRWLELKGVLPLLTQKQYYQDLTYGYARGNEPVTYVRQIRNYRNIMHAQMAKKRGAHGEDL